jgi:hypothetical protein
MADKVYEKVSPGKVSENITRDAREASKKLVGDMVKKFEGIGFNPKEVAPLIRKGVKEGAEDNK